MTLFTRAAADPFTLQGLDVRRLLEVNHPSGFPVTFQDGVYSIAHPDDGLRLPPTNPLDARDVRQPFLSALLHLRKCFDTVRPNTVRLLHDFFARTHPDRISDLVRTLLTMAPPFLPQDYLLARSLEYVFCMPMQPRLLSTLTSNHIDRKPVVSCIAYTLSVFHGRPDPSLIADLPSHWRPDLHQRVAAFARHIHSVHFLLHPPYCLRTVIERLVEHFDSLWTRFHRQYSTDEVVCMYGAEVRFDQGTGYYTMKYSEPVPLDNPLDLLSLKETLPAVMPLVMSATRKIIEACDLNRSVLCKRPGADSAAVYVGDRKDKKMGLVVKASGVQTCFLEASEILLEYLFSQMLWSQKRFSKVRSHFARMYAVRSDVVFVDGAFAYASSPYPSCLVAERLPGVMLCTIVRELHRDTALSLLQKILKVLNTLYVEAKFTHYDLHSGNILVDPDTYEVYIIDMGRCRFEYEGMWVGRKFDIGTEACLGIRPHVAYPAHDIFRLLMTFYEAGHTNVGSAFLTLFPGFRPEDVLISHKDTVYSLPYLEDLAGMTYLDALNVL